MSQAVTDLSLSVHGQMITDSDLHATLTRLYPDAFTRDDFAREFQNCCRSVPVMQDTIRRVMQHLKRRKQITYSPSHKHWRFVDHLFPMNGMAKTLPLNPLPPLITPEEQADPEEGFTPAENGFKRMVLHLASWMSVLALMALNASFAYGLAETQFFQIAFVTGLMASDLMRPLLIAQGLKSFGINQLGRGALAFLVAFSLAPVSILSSTTVISAALSLGAESNQQRETRSTTRQTLQSEFERMKGLADQEWHLRKIECQNGGCGKRAQGHKASAMALEKEMKNLLPKIIQLTETEHGKSSFVSRSVKGFERLHIYGKDREMLIPILLALTLEIAALFGPGLLLTQKKYKKLSPLITGKPTHTGA